MLKKGDFVRHTKQDIDIKLGLGILVEDQYGDRARVYFENELRTLEMDLTRASLVCIDNPGDSASFLENALYEDKGDRVPFPQILEKFLEDFEGGFYGRVYEHYERDDKVQMHQFVMENLSKECFEEALTTGTFDEITKAIQKSYSLKGFSLLATFEMMKIHTAFKEPQNLRELVMTYYDLLYGDSSVGERLEKARRSLDKFEMAKWPIITFPLFARYPEHYLFVKPEMTQKAALNRGFNIEYSSQVNAGTYQRILDFAKDLKNRLSSDAREALTPRDMIDVQGFMWCTFAVGWSPEGIQTAKLEAERGDF